MKSIKSLIDSSSIFPGGFFVYEAYGDEKIIHVNQEVLNIFGCNSLEEFEKITGNSFKKLVYQDDLDKVERSIIKQINTNESKLDYVEYRIKKLDGTIRYVEDFGRLVETSEGKYFIVFISDITEKYNRNLKYKKSITDELKHRIKYDNLTDLYNKNEFIKIVSETINYNTEAYIVYFNIDRFSLFTKSFGSNAADNLLIYIASILLNLANEYHIISTRLYNDKFAFYFEHDIETLKNVIDMINHFVKHYIAAYDINISYGIYKISDKNVSVGSMLDYAEMAIESIKDRYDKSFAIYDESLSNDKIKEQKTLNHMEEALEHNEFLIYMQPKYEISNGKIIGAESLVRWFYNDRIISPGEFIPILEHNGLIAKLDLYVWEKTIQYIKNRIDNHLKVVPISVNVSRFFFTLNNFIPSIQKLLDKYKIPKYLLEFEITESLFSNWSLISEKVTELRNLGFKVLMDDFGSGYSGLSVLKDVDFDIMKLDLKFFESSNKKAKIIIESVIKMAKKLEIPVIAEGVETINHLNMLKEYGCDYAQGYYYSMPISILEFNKLLDEGK